MLMPAWPLGWPAPGMPAMFGSTSVDVILPIVLLTVTSALGVTLKAVNVSTEAIRQARERLRTKSLGGQHGRANVEGIHDPVRISAQIAELPGPCVCPSVYVDDKVSLGHLTCRGRKITQQDLTRVGVGHLHLISSEAHVSHFDRNQIVAIGDVGLKGSSAGCSCAAVLSIANQI